jgi:hypothetical protein
VNAPLFVTVAAVNYLAFVLTLERSLRRHMAGSRLYALITDASPMLLERIRGKFGSRIEFIGTHNVDGAELDSMRNYYSILEFNSACKIWALDHVLKTEQNRDCIFLDPDTYVLNSIDAAPAANSFDIALTAHALHPYPNDGELPSELELALAGHINGGFIQARNTPESRMMIEWLLPHTRFNWFVAPTYGMYADQQWLGLLPLFFDKSAGLLKDPGVNIAYWNLHERPLRSINGQITVVGGADTHPARLFHFSGFSAPSNGRLTLHSNRRFEQTTEIVLGELMNAYEQDLGDQVNAVRPMNLSGDLGFSSKPLITRMKLAQHRWGIHHRELDPPGPLGRLARKLDGFLKRA